MIGTIRGRLAEKQAPGIIVDCNGVGYEIETPMSTFLELPPVGEEIFLHTHLQVRETAHSLFGFATAAEKHLFRTLLSVSGVGAKMGLAILSAVTVGDFERCVQLEDTAMLVKIPGVGKKTAERLIIEMRDKIDKTPDLRVVSASGTVAADARSEAVDALVALGYKPTEVKKLLGSIDVGDRTAEDIIRQALRQVVN